MNRNGSLQKNTSSSKYRISQTKKVHLTLLYLPGVLPLAGVFPLLGVPGIFLGVDGTFVNLFSPPTLPAYPLSPALCTSLAALLAASPTCAGGRF